MSIGYRTAILPILCSYLSLTSLSAHGNQSDDNGLLDMVAEARACSLSDAHITLSKFSDQVKNMCGDDTSNFKSWDSSKKKEFFGCLKELGNGNTTRGKDIYFKKREDANTLGMFLLWTWDFKRMDDRISCDFMSEHMTNVYSELNSTSENPDLSFKHKGGTYNTIMIYIDGKYFDEVTLPKND